MAAQRLRSAKTGGPSRVGRLAKFCITLYLLAAIVYTAYHFLLAPAYHIVATRNPLAPSPKAQPLVRLPLNHAVPALPAAHSRLRNPAATPPTAPDDSAPLPDKNDVANAKLRAQAIVAAQMKKHPALENAAVKAADIREEDSGDRVWAAAEVGKNNDESSGEGYVRPAVLSDGRELVQKRIHGPDGVQWGMDQMNWHHPSSPLAHSGQLSPHANYLDHETTISIPEDHFLSLSFSSALQPSKVIPYYYRASAPDLPGFVKEDVTITTLVTSNRFKVFEKLVERYQGPISATVHVSDTANHSELLQALDSMYTSSPLMMKFVDIHLVYDPFDRQFNMWRNVAKFFARTDYVMMLDVDFWICTDFRSRMLASTEIMSRLRTGTAAFVVPAFEFNKQSDGVDPDTFPATKEALVELVKAEKIGMFHKSWAPGHGSTNYTRYYEAQPGEVYRVLTYTHSYEPYVVFKKEGTPWCDERFIGYGGNKAACLYELYLSGVSFYVLPDDFLIHQSHAYAEKARKHERRYNRKLYIDFREELCFRYFNHFSDDIESSRAQNLMGECRKIKGFTATTTKLLAAL